MNRSNAAARALWWSLATAYIGLTYATLGAMPDYWDAINDGLGGNGILFQYSLYSTAGIALFGFLYREGFLHSTGNLIVTGAFLVAFAVMFHLEKNPGEKIHMFQYGVFGWLLYKALGLHFNRTSVSLYLTGGVICLVAGAVDEFIQDLLPNRYFTLHDIVINGLSGVIVLAYIYFYNLHKQTQEA